MQCVKRQWYEHTTTNPWIKRAAPCSFCPPAVSSIFPVQTKTPFNTWKRTDNRQTISHREMRRRNTFGIELSTLKKKYYGHQNNTTFLFESEKIKKTHTMTGLNKCVTGEVKAWKLSSWKLAWKPWEKSWNPKRRGSPDVEPGKLLSALTLPLGTGQSPELLLNLTHVEGHYKFR